MPRRCPARLLLSVKMFLQVYHLMHRISNDCGTQQSTKAVQQ